MEMTEKKLPRWMEDAQGYSSSYRLVVEPQTQYVGTGVKRERILGAVEKVGHRSPIDFKDRFQETPLLYRGAGRYYVYLGVRKLLLSLDDDALPQWEGVYKLKLEAEDISRAEVEQLPSMAMAELVYGAWR